MTKTLIIVLVVGLALMLVGGLAWAKYRGYCQMGPERMVERVSERLSLNEAQKAKLQTLGQSLASLRDQWRDKRQGMQNDVLELLRAPDFDRDRATMMLDQRHQAWRERGDELLSQFADFSDSLDADQRTELATMVEERMARRWHGPAWSH